MSETIRVGVSACLLGHPVRYDGGHKRDPYIVETLESAVPMTPSDRDPAVVKLAAKAFGYKPID